MLCLVIKLCYCIVTVTNVLNSDTELFHCIFAHLTLTFCLIRFSYSSSVITPFSINKSKTKLSKTVKILACADDNYSCSHRYRSPFSVKRSQTRPSRLQAPFAPSSKSGHGLLNDCPCRQLPSRINRSTIRSSETPSRLNMPALNKGGYRQKSH